MLVGFSKEASRLDMAVNVPYDGCNNDFEHKLRVFHLKTNTLHKHAPNTANSA